MRALNILPAFNITKGIAKKLFLISAPIQLRYSFDTAFAALAARELR